VDNQEAEAAVSGGEQLSVGGLGDAGSECLAKDEVDFGGGGGDGGTVFAVCGESRDVLADCAVWRQSGGQELPSRGE